uniref:Phospholipase A2 isozymes PA3A/PA3B/PA5 n=2 Tax=Heloderma TaxID=8550 RepID=PA23_HELSU|nr:RecName: Full=Phospholipase A2 isozymes PA3A/PA3B/PA5; Short=PLA2; AltName: Full=Phosphatidylcholine 2-acylhydrolase [Heloderma suspectum]
GAFIMPGTLWCGAGNAASDYSQLGTEKDTDMCCRDHDHCENWISALEYKHGMRNYYPSTISHCDCDNQFRSCLMKLKDGTADYVGQTYFNVLKIPCFELEEGEGCVDWNFWLECTESKIMPVAKLVSAAPYQAQAETQSGEGR